MKDFVIKAKVTSNYNFVVKAQSEKEAILWARDMILSGTQLTYAEDMELDCSEFKDKKANKKTFVKSF